MKTRGQIAPETEAAVREEYEAPAKSAETVTKEIAKANTDTRAAYNELVDSATVETAQQSIFASLLEVHVGSVEEYDSWLAAHEDFEVVLAGTKPVPRRVWHPVWPRDAVVAVSFQERADAAVATVRRQAFGRHYRSILEDG